MVCIAVEQVPDYRVETLLLMARTMFDCQQHDWVRALSKLLRRSLVFLEQVAGDRPLVLLLDDLHWADSSTVDLLFFLSQRLRRPVLLVLAFRALDLRGREDHHPLRQTLWRIEGYCPVRQVELRPLSAGSLQRLAEEVLASSEVDPDLVHWLARASEGNPLYVQEYLWYLQDTHAKAHDSPEWISSFDPGDADDLVGLPRTLEAIVAERVEDLGYEDLRVLQLAAVIGPVFGPAELLALSDMGAEPTKRALRFLCQRIGLVRATDAGDAYTFYHRVIRDYVRQRHEADDPLDYREINRLRADYLAERPVDRLDWHEDVALHFHEARADEEALIYSLEAAEAAKDLGALKEAIRFLSWAVEHADRGRFDSPRHLAGIYGHLAFVALARDRVQDSWGLFEKVSRLAEDSGSAGRLYESHLWRAKHHLACLRLADAQQELDVMAELAERLGVGQTVAHHRRDSGRRLALAGEPAKAAAEYAAYLSHMLDNEAWPSRAITYLLLQARELADELSPAAGIEFLGDLHSCLGSTTQLGVFATAAEAMRGYLRASEDPKEGLRRAGLGSYLGTSASTATELIFRFRIEDLAAFRRRHAFSTGAR